jgi:hypothetical protein
VTGERLERLLPAGCRLPGLVAAFHPTFTAPLRDGPGLPRQGSAPGRVHQIAGQADRTRLEQALGARLAQNGLPRDRVCMVELEPDAPPPSIQGGDHEQG